MVIISLNWAATFNLEDSLGIELKPVPDDIQELRDFREWLLKHPKNKFSPHQVCRHKGFISECYWCTLNGKPTKARLFYDALNKKKGKKPESMTSFAGQFGINNSDGHRMFKLYTKNNESGKWNIMYGIDEK